MTLFLAALVGAAIYRLRGWNPAPEGVTLWWKRRPLLQLAFALPYGALACVACGWLPGLIVLALTTGAVVTGHASYIDLNGVRPGAANAPADGQIDEWYGGWIPWPHTYIHDFLGLTVAGLLITVPAGLAAAVWGFPMIGTLVALSGVLKPFAYAGARFVPQRWIADLRWIDEPLCGALLWGSLAAILLA